MRKLAEAYNKNGYQFRQVQRMDNVGIYEQVIPETGRIAAYEVFEIIQNPERTIGGKLVEAGESTPSAEMWGSKGFTVHTMEAALVKMEHLLRMAERREKEKKLI